MQRLSNGWRIILILISFIALNSPFLNSHCLSASPLPPTDLRGHQIADEFSAQTDLINVITWNPPRFGTPPVSYSIFRDPMLTKLAASIPADDKLKFRDHNRESNATYTYFLVSRDASGQQSEPIGIRFIGPKTELIKTPKQRLVSLEVFPLSPTIAVGFRQQFRAIGIFEDGSKKDLTHRVVWTSSHPNVALISSRSQNAGEARGLSPGKSKIKASLLGLSASTTLTVSSATLETIEVTPFNSKLAVGFQEQFTAIGIFSDNTTQDLTDQVIWTSSRPKVASISNDTGSQGVATGLKPGSSKIVATHNKVSGSTTLFVTTAVLETISVTPANPTAAAGTFIPFTATGIFSDESTKNLTNFVTWSSSDEAVALISNAQGRRGIAKTLSQGSTQIRAHLRDISGTTTLTVTSAVLIRIAVDPILSKLPVEFSEQFSATGLFSDLTTQDLTAQVTWTSSNPAVASISNAAGREGLATAESSPGSTQIQAALNGLSGSAALVVTPATLVSIDITPINPLLTSGFTLAFTATGHFSDSTTKNLTPFVTWISSNTSVATISNASPDKGVATGAIAGTTLITATLKGITASTKLSVTTTALVAIAVNPIKAVVPLGIQVPYTAIGIFSDFTIQNLTSQVTWDSSDPTIASISNASGSQGLVTPQSIGSTNIEALLNGISGSATLTITPANLVLIVVSPSNPTLPTGLSLQFTATGIFSDGTTQDLTKRATWISDNPSIAYISTASGSQGLATGIQPGNTIIQAIYKGVTGSTTLAVSSAILTSLEVTPINPSIATDFTQQFTATGTFNDSSTQDLTTQVTWTSSSSAVFISNASGSQGLAMGITSGSASIQATLNGVTGSTTLTVLPIELSSIQVTPVNPSIAAGSTLQFTAIGTFNDSSTQDLTTSVTWTSSNEPVAFISNASGNQGLASGLSAGSTIITATRNKISGTTTLTIE